MKSTTTSAMTLGLVACATAMPYPFNILSKRQTICILPSVTDPSSTQIEASINQWHSDVSTVNNFLNTAASITDPDTLKNTTETVMKSAADEPCQLSTLLANSDFLPTPPADVNCAGMDLMKVFGPHVLDNLQAIIDSPSETSVVTMAINDINNFRCCNVLPDVDVLWKDSADDAGVSNLVPISAPREDACASITCTNAPNCAALSDG